jgi:hypothetical protein
MMTDDSFYKIEKPPANLMFVRFRSNVWNTDLACEAADFYSERNIPVVLTFMAYHELTSVLTDYQKYYAYTKRTLNPYWALTYSGFEWITGLAFGDRVFTCGRVGKDSKHITLCRDCGNCIREYYNTIERMKNV